MATNTTITLGNAVSWTKGAYTAYLAPWGAGSLVQGKDYTDTMTFTGDLFPNSATISWKWPTAIPTASGVYNFDAISFGNYNYALTNTVAANQIKNIGTLTQTHGLGLGGDTSKYDVITDFFLTSKANDFNTKLFEIEVVLHTPAYAKTYVDTSTQLGTYTDAQGHAWTVAIDKHAALAPDILIMPKGGGEMLSGTVDLKGMLDWLVSQKVLTGNEYFNGLGLGAEVRQGSGSLTINNFSVDYKAASAAPTVATGPTKNLYAPVIDSNGGGASAALSLTSGTKAVTTVHASDADGTAVLYYIKGGADASLFTIDKNTGALAFANAPNAASPKDAGANNVYDVIVQAIDGVHAATQTIAVTVTNTNLHAPVIDSSGGGASAALSAASGTAAVATVHATDADGTAPTYAITGGADASLFTLDARTGALAFKSAPSFAAPKDAGGDNVYNVTVQASDGLHADTQALAVTVTGSAAAPAKPAVTAPATSVEIAVPSAATSKTLAMTSDHYDAAWQMTRTSSTEIVRVDGGQKTIEHHAATGALTGADLVSSADGKATVQRYDAKWAFAGADVTTINGAQTITDHFDANWKATSHDIFSVQGGKATEQHYDANWAFTGADVATPGAGKTGVDHYDANWKLTGHDNVFNDGAKLTVQHFDASMKFVSADVLTLTAAQAVNHDALKGWLMA